MKKYFPLALLVIFLGYLASTLVPAKNPTALNLSGFGSLPVLINGRIKPLDTVARTSLLMTQGRQRLVAPDGRSLQPVEWLADMMFAPRKADTYKVFLIENHEVLDLLNLKVEDGDGKKRFSYEQIRKSMPELEHQARLAEQTNQQLRTPFQRQLVHVYDRAVQYIRLRNSAQLADSPNFLTELVTFQKALPAGVAAIVATKEGQPANREAVSAMSEMRERFVYMEEVGLLNLVPPARTDSDPTHWRKIGAVLQDSFVSGNVDADAVGYAALGHAWRNQDAKQFNELIALFGERIGQRFDSEMARSRIESRFNSAQPFDTGIYLYVAALLLGLISWLVWPDALGRAAYYLMGLGLLVSTVGIFTRMWLEARPPVTNLYSSALFVGWGAVLLCVVLERIYRNGIGSVAGGMIGFASLVIAHHLSMTGDTLEMMRAVLDSNFWLATHVVIITIGYSATFLAGFLAIIYILRGVFTKSLDRATADSLARMVYGIVCFATLFSLVGTILGGIWADQSWGRFWGWDPKENGALMIVLWNAVILHARWGGLVKQRGLMALAVFGNVITAWSWFGTNMLGVGLHSYGFMDAAFYSLVAFVSSQLLIITIASFPVEKWLSFRPRTA